MKNKIRVKMGEIVVEIETNTNLDDTIKKATNILKNIKLKDQDFVYVE